MDEVEEIKQRINLVDFIAQYLTLKKAGANYKALCPFHSERTASFMVSEDKQIFKCFGCGAGGDVIEFLMKMENLEFPEALEILADRAGVILAKKEFKKKYQQVKEEKSRLYKINNLAAKIFHKILLEHQSAGEARAYLERRKINHQTIKEFRMGYAPKKTVLNDFLRKFGFNQQEISQAGGPDRFKNRLIFPIFDVMDNVVGFTGRVLHPQDEPKYLNTPETQIFHKGRILYGLNCAKKAIKEQKTSLIVEGQMDVVLSHQAGVKNTVASSGTALTPEHLEILARYHPNLIFAFDQDEAGEKAALKSIKMAIGLGFNVKIIIFPENYKDAGEVVSKNPALWRAIASHPLDAIEWIFSEAFASKDNLTAQNKKEIARQILPFIKIVPDEIERTHWSKILAKKLDVSPIVINDALAKVQLMVKKDKLAKDTNPQHLSVEENLLGILLFFPEHLSQAVNKLDYQDFPVNSAAQKIYKFLQSCYTRDVCLPGKKAGITTENLMRYLGKNLSSELAEKAKFLILDIENHYQDVSQEEVAKDILASISRIKEAKKARVKKEFAVAIHQAEEQKDRGKVKKLLKEFQYVIK